MPEFEVVVPAELDQEAVLLGWLRANGDTVEAGEPLVELTVEKAQYELEAPASGVLRHRAKEEDVLAAGTVIGVIET